MLAIVKKSIRSFGIYDLAKVNNHDLKFTVLTETIMKRKVYDHVKYITLRSKSMFSIMKNRLYDHEKYTILLKYMVLTESIRSLAESIRSFEKIIRSFPDDLLVYDLFIESTRLFSATQWYNFKI